MILSQHKIHHRCGNWHRPLYYTSAEHRSCVWGASVWAAMHTVELVPGLPVVQGPRRTTGWSSELWEGEEGCRVAQHPGHSLKEWIYLPMPTYINPEYSGWNEFNLLDYISLGLGRLKIQCCSSVSHQGKLWPSWIDALWSTDRLGWGLLPFTSNQPPVRAWFQGFVHWARISQLTYESGWLYSLTPQLQKLQE